MVAVNPKILVWARTKAGLELGEDVAKKIFTRSKNLSVLEKLKQVERGEREPTRAQLNSMAKAYRQPLLTFYLAEPPRKGDRGMDFRTLPQQSHDARENFYLDVLMRNIRTSQSLVRDLLDEEEAEPLHFVGSATMDMGAQKIADDICSTLGFDLHHFRNRKTYPEAFAYLRDCIEGRGVFVMRLSNLGSHHTTIPVNVFRGFVYADSVAPFIVINRNDAKSAYSFTTLHELAHIWLGSSGVSGNLEKGSVLIEHFCNQVAARILLPRSDLKTLSKLRSETFSESVNKISVMAWKWKVSHTMIAFNMLTENLISQSRWEDFRDQFRREFAKQKRLEKEARDIRGDTPFDMNRIYRNNLGKQLVNLVKASLSEGTLTHSKAALVLSVTPRRVEAILSP